MALSSGSARLREAPAGRLDVKNVGKNVGDQAARFKERTAKAREQTEKMKDIRGQMTAAIAIGDIDTMKILNASFKEANEQAQKNRGDISSIMGGLLTGYRDIGVALKAAEAFTSAETQLIEDAKSVVKKAGDNVLGAKGNWYIIPGSRERTIAKAEEALKTAEQGVVTATQMAEAQRRERLNNMSLQQSMQLQQGITQELTEIAQGRIQGIEENLTEIQANTDETSDTLMTDTKKLEELDAELNAANTELNTLNEELASYTQNSSQWMECRDRIRKKSRARDDIESERNATFLRNEQAQVFIEAGRVQEEGQRELLAQHKNWIALLQMGAQQRDVHYGVYLDLLKDNADQEAMARVDETASETDERVAENTAQIVQGMRKNTMDWMDRAPKRLENMRKIVGATVESQANFEEELNRRIEEFQQNLKPGYDDRQTYRDAQPTA